jgi:hypothetical protein
MYLYVLFNRMFEHHKESLIPLKKFHLRLLKSSLVMLLIITLSLVIGIFGYRYFENMLWDDALLNAATTLVGTGPLDKLTTSSGKVFVAIYSIYCSIILLIAIWIVLTPIIHRILHRFFRLPYERN